MIVTTLLWQPPEESIAAANMTRFRDFVNEHHQMSFDSYDSLYHWSVDDIPAFWAAVWEFLEIQASAPYETPVEDLSVFPGTRWFPGARLNFAANLLRLPGAGDSRRSSGGPRGTSACPGRRRDPPPESRKVRKPGSPETPRPPPRRRGYRPPTSGRGSRRSRRTSGGARSRSPGSGSCWRRRYSLPAVATIVWSRSSPPGQSFSFTYSSNVSLPALFQFIISSYTACQTGGQQPAWSDSHPQSWSQW